MNELKYNYCDPIGGTKESLDYYKEQCGMVDAVRYKYRILREDAVKKLEAAGWQLDKVVV